MDLLVKCCYFVVKLVTFYQIVPNKSAENFYQALIENVYQALIENFEIVKNHYPKFKLEKITKTNLIGSLGKKLQGQTDSSAIFFSFVIFRKFGHGNNSGENI